MLSVKAAQRRILRIMSPVGAEKVPLAHALGRVLAADVRSIAFPLFDNSSVDGFAVIASDVLGAARTSPCELHVVADIPAGVRFGKKLKSGQAARIMTGAPMPPNATAVVMLEDTDLAGRGNGSALPATIRVYKAPVRGENVRRRGMDLRRGRKVLATGQRLRAQDLGLLAMFGSSTALVYRRPRVALLSSGNELTAPGRPLRAGEVRDTNSVTLGSLIAEAGGDLIPLGVARDNRSAIERLLERAVKMQADLIVSSAGVSVGAFDLVREAILAHGRLLFWRVNVRPGKPLAVGEYRGIPLIGLPGNPVSAFVGFELFVRPALFRLGGASRLQRNLVHVIVGEHISSDGRESYLRARVSRRGGSSVAMLTGHQGSGNLHSLVEANALLMVPAGVKSLAVGDQADAWLF